jgi:hypothetical protein
VHRPYRPSVVERFGLDVEKPRRTCPDRDRHFYGLCHGQPTEPVPLARVYVLEDGETVGVASLPPQERVMELVTNTYAVGVLGDDDEAATNFGRCATLTEGSDVRRLQRPRRLDVLSGVVEAVKTDLR